jgi:secreted trypsin-like serine protease
LVLTAAHCFVPESGKVSAWEGIVLSGTNFESALNAQKYPIDQIAVHPGWNGVFNDLALVSIKTALPRIHRIVPFESSSSGIVDSKGVYLVGYGNTELGSHDDEVMRYTESSYYNEIKAENYNGISIVNQLRIRDDKKNPGGACQGDSGGPAFLKDSGKVLGIVSGMHSFVQGPEKINSCMSGDVNYTFVAPYFSWIQSVTGLKLEESQSVKPVEAGPLLSLNKEYTIRPEEFVLNKHVVTRNVSTSFGSMDGIERCR